MNKLAVFNSSIKGIFGVVITGVATAIIAGIAVIIVVNNQLSVLGDGQGQVFVAIFCTANYNSILIFGKCRCTQIQNSAVVRRIKPTVFCIAKHGQRVQEEILRIYLAVYSYGINIITPSRINRAEIQRVDASCKANIRSGVRNLFERASHSKCSVQLIVVICGKLQRILTRLGYVMQTNYSIIFIN